MIFRSRKEKAGEALFTLLLSELKDCASLARVLAPIQLVGLLRHYVAECESTIQRLSGEMVRVEGGTILAAWPEGEKDPPSTTNKACEAALAIVGESHELRLWALKNRYPEVTPTIKVALCRGKCIYVKRGKLYIDLLGTTVNKLNKLSISSGTARNMVLADESIPEICSGYQFEKTGDGIYELRR